MNYIDAQLHGYSEFCALHVKEADHIPTLPFQPGTIDEMVASMLDFKRLLAELKRIFINRCTTIAEEFYAKGLSFESVRYEFAQIANKALQSFILMNGSGCSDNRISIG